MLNPSTADAEIDDPTIRRCMAFARSWGFSCLSVRNLYALRATDPARLEAERDPVGGERGDAELAAATIADLVVVAWGANASPWRERKAVELLSGARLMCLGKTKSGHPRHPLYVRADQSLTEWSS